MNKLVRFFVMATVALSFGLTGCSDEDPASAWEVNKTANAKIIGYVTYQPDLSSSKLDAYPKAEDVKLVASVAYQSLNGNLSTADRLELTASYNATTGMYSIDVPATTAGVSVAITFSGFSGTQKPSGTESSTQNGYYTPQTPVITTSVKSGQTLVATKVVYDFTPAPVQ